MITQSEYEMLVADCIATLRKQDRKDVADQLEEIIKKPIVETPATDANSSRHIMEAKERPRTPKEQLQAIIEFLEAHLLHTAQTVSRLAELTDHDPSSMEWIGDEESLRSQLIGSKLSIDRSEFNQMLEHLQALKSAVEAKS